MLALQRVYSQWKDNISDPTKVTGSYKLRVREIVKLKLVHLRQICSDIEF